MSDLAREWVVMTGVTRGIGQSLATELRSRGYSVCGIVRPAHTEKVQLSLDKVIAHDLLKPLGSSAISQLNEFLNTHRVIGVVHAAGLLGPMLHQPTAEKFVEWSQWWQSYRDTFQVNLFSGIQLINICRTHLQEWSGVSGVRSPFVLHLSSGAAVKPYAGWDAYCSSKAAILMDFKCMAAKVRADECCVLSVAPGTVMTDMMKQVLSAHPNDFPALSKFKELEKNGGLVEPSQPAKLICDWLMSSSQDSISHWHGELYDVRLSSSPTK